jgi:hypothetical protein
VRNTGNVILTAVPEISGAGPLGLGRRRTAGGPLSELLPSQSVDVTERLEGLPPLLRVAGRVQLRPAPVGGAHLAARPEPTAAVAATWAPPWFALGVLAGLGALGAARLLRPRPAAPGAGGGAA